MDIWIYGYLDIWIYGWIKTMVGSSWGKEGCRPFPPRSPPTRPFMRGSAPQTPHRFHGYTPPHPTPPHLDSMAGSTEAIEAIEAIEGILPMFGVRSGGW